ncbi:DUF6597 domain-containing transcriptional factor [Ferruginibacter sp.]
MIFKEILPSVALRPYIKEFYFYEASSDMNYDDVVFPSGNMEVVFNLGSGNWLSNQGDSFVTTPQIELWGQITEPLAIKSAGKNTMMGVRFFTYSAAYFFNENVAALNNQVQDAADLFGSSLKNLYQQLLNTDDLNDRVNLIETYLLKRLQLTEKRHDKIRFIGQIVNGLGKNIDTNKVMDISMQANVSPRYLNMLFTQYTGLAPKLFCKINRFQNSLSRINKNKEKLTGVAYESGYFDQSHFIREFKQFTGFTPNAFASKASAINQVLAGN